MSLWSVEDESTNLLTERFFTYLQGDRDELAALRLARSDLRKAGYEHPFFWAPFILVTPSPVPAGLPSEGTASFGLWNVAVPLLARVGLLLLARVRLSELPTEVLSILLPTAGLVPLTLPPAESEKLAPYVRLVCRSLIEGAPQEIALISTRDSMGPLAVRASTGSVRTVSVSCRYLPRSP
jgi:hypothetical protein